MQQRRPILPDLAVRGESPPYRTWEKDLPPSHGPQALARGGGVELEGLQEGRPLDLWRVVFSARNESVRAPDPLLWVEWGDEHV